MAELKIPTETVALPSKGLLYPETSPLAKGQIEMKYMTAKEEDILTNVNYFRQGVVLDKLLQALIVTPIDYNELLVGDKNAILIAARILGYGKDYDFNYINPETNNVELAKVDLTSIDSLPLDESLYTRGKNEFNFELPFSKVVITLKLLTHGDETKIDKEIEGLKKINPQHTSNVTTRLKHLILAVNGDREVATVRDFVDNMLARDVKALREYINKITPDVNLKVSVTTASGNVMEGVDLPINVNFFWPDTSV